MRLTIITFCTVTLASSAALAAEPTGDWRVEDGSAIIRIDNCRGALWGVVAWEKVPGRDERSGIMCARLWPAQMGAGQDRAGER